MCGIDWNHLVLPLKGKRCWTPEFYYRDPTFFFEAMGYKSYKEQIAMIWP